MLSLMFPIVPVMPDRIALGEGLVNCLHKTGNIFICLTGGLKQHCCRIIELDRFVDVGKQLWAFVHEVGNHSCSFRIAASRLPSGLHDFLLNLRLVSERGGRVLDLFIDAPELFHEGVDLGQAEPDADCAEKFRRGALDVRDCSVDFFYVAFAYFEANLVDKLHNRHEQSPSFHGRFYRSVLTVPLKADRISLISRKAIIQRGAHDHGKHGSRR